MSLTDEYYKAKKKRQQENQPTGNLADDYFRAKQKLEKDKEEQQRIAEVERVKSEIFNGDIAPVKDDSEKWYDGFLQLGDALKDGYQFGDVTKTLLGTDRDILVNIPAGVVGWGENIVDAGATAIGNVASNFGNKELAEKMQEFAKKDLYDEVEVTRKLLKAAPKATTIFPGLNQFSGLANAASAIVTLDEWLSTKEADNGFGGTMTVRDDNSVLGYKSDSLIQSAGEMAVKTSLPPFVGNLITGVTVYGEQAEQALKEDATLSEAHWSGAISAAAEIMFEKLSGGIKIGGKTLDEGLTRLVSKNISNVALKNLAHFGIDTAGESLEELATEFVGKLGTALYKEEDLAEILFSEEALNDYITAAVSGGLMGGGFNAYNAVSGTATGHDYKTGLTANEQAVVDKEFENRVAEQEKNGKKLTKKEKDKIYDDVLTALDRGYISTDTIEEVLGKDLRSGYDALQQESDEFDSLYDTATSQLSKKQQDRLAELESKNTAKPYKTALQEARGKLSQDIFNMAQGDRLAESYRERARLGQAFEADFSKYEKTRHKDAARKTLENAVAFGMNNTNRIHDLVDMAAQISGDTGRVFSFQSQENVTKAFIEQQTKKIASLEKIANKTAEQAKELADLKSKLAQVQSGEITVNGTEDGSSIVLNMDSPKLLNALAGHEVTHVLEVAKSYNALKKAVFSYAKTKGVDINKEIAKRKQTYTGIEKANAEQELVADLVGDYLFTDYDFVSNLAVQDRNVFQRIYDEIKYLLKIATTGSKEARELERVKHNFDKAYREASKQSKGDGKTQHSLSKTDTAYMDAVEHADMETAQRMVDEAAKRAGFPVEVFHGTTQFGFTKADVSKSDDHISFFATDSPEVAMTYSGDESAKSIALAINEDPGKFTSDYLKQLDDLESLVNRVSPGYDFWGKSMDLNGLRVKAQEGHADYADIAQELDSFVENLVADLKRNASVKSEDVAKIREVTDAMSDTLSAISEFKDAKKGNYRLFANTDGLLEIDAKGQKWNEIPVVLDKDNFMYSSGKETTRTVAEYAYSTGKYKGVVFKNVIDDGGKGDVRQTKPATVYIFFNPQEQVKSADPVTYDDNGNVIPLSERFNAKNDDIRYSLSDSDGRQLSKGQQEYFKNSQMRDENGNLKVMYHGSQDAGFHVFDSSMSDDGRSFFFVDRNEVAASYSGTSETYEARTFRTAEDINKFFSEFSNADVLERADSLKKELDSQYGALVNDLSAHYAANHYDTPEAAAKSTLMDKKFAEISIRVGLPSELADRINAYFELKTEENKARIEARKSDNDIWKYKVVEQDGKFTLLYDGERVADSDTAQGIYEEFCWYEGVGEGDANYKVYLNLTHPLVVDAEGRNWNNVTLEFSQDLADKYKSLSEEERAALANLASWEDVSIFRSEIRQALADTETGTPGTYDEDFAWNVRKAYEKLGGNRVNMHDLFSIAEDNFSDLAIEAWAVKHMTTRDYAQRAKEQGYDGVIFKNIHDNGGYSNGSEGASTVAVAFDSEQIKSVANENPTADKDIRYSLSNVTDAENAKGLDAKREVAFSLSRNTEYADNAIKKNLTTKAVDPKVLEAAKAVREYVAKRLTEMVDKGVALPPDEIGQTWHEDKSYGGTMENTLVCPRSLAPEAFMDAVSKNVGRPLTVKEQIYVGQELMTMMTSNEELRNQSFLAQCVYCYVAADRMAQREFLGEYIKQRDAVLQKVANNPNIDVSMLEADHTALANWWENKKSKKPALSEIGKLYQEFLNKRKPTGATYNRFKMWVENYANGSPMIDGNHLASIEEISGDLSNFDAALVPQIEDAWRYAQSASWAKKRTSYVAYNGQILEWDSDVVDALNEHYGMRMYSFSDYHPAFVLENMQMITDAAVRGLKTLAYTKDLDFAEIFAPTNANINISTFGFEKSGQVYEDNQMGAEWEKAKALREQYPNVGITFVATNDAITEWAMKQDWIDVVIPYHMVKTGKIIAEHFGYKNYTRESSDKKKAEWRKDKTWKEDHVSSIAPTMHDNNLETYLAALEANGLKPRFERFLKNPETRPYYMKLVNECRLPASQSQAVQPKFNEDAIKRTLARLETEGYYQPIGGSVDRMYELAAGVADNMANQFAPTKNSLSYAGEQPFAQGNFRVSGKDARIQKPAVEAPVAPVADEAPMFPDTSHTAEDESATQERLASLGDADVPPETESYSGEADAPIAPRDPFEGRDFKGVGKQNVTAFMHDNPEVKPFFQMQAKAMLGDLQNSVKGERWYNDDVYYESGGEYGWSGTQRQTTDDIAYLLDMGYTYAQIEKGLNAIIEDNGAENIAMAKRIEFALNDRLRKGYTDINGVEIPPNEDYINLLAQKQTAEAVEEQIAPHTDADAPMEDIAPVRSDAVQTEQTEQTPQRIAQVKVNEKVPKKTLREKIRGALESVRETLNTAASTFGDKGWVFENLSKKTGNRELEGKYNFMHYSESRAQEHIKKKLMPLADRIEQTGNVKGFFEYAYHLHNIDRMSLETDENRIKRESLRENFKGLTDKQIQAIAMEWIKKDTPKEVRERIKLAREYIDASKGKNKPVFGDSVTADVSREKVAQYEKANPGFKEIGETLVEYSRELRNMLVDGGVISQETADLWEKMYPHYVPIRREGKDGQAVTVPLDTNKTGVNAPIKGATGGDSNIEDLLETMVKRTEQTYKAVAKNSFGVELMHTLGTEVAKEQTSLDQILDSLDSHEDLLQEGKNGKSPTFTVFENGKRVTFEITKEMFDALKPTSEKLSKTHKIPNKLSNLHRALLTDKNPVFLVKNPIKDSQDVLFNSQHAAKTYANFPVAIKEMASHGKWYEEYMANGGEQNTYFDSETKEFKGEAKGVRKWLNKISEANNFVERLPRLAEYIASRQAGRSIEVSMLDAARVTTNFAAGADVTKYLNRNGFTFLNASVQGTLQNIRNVREAHAQGVKGWAILAAKVMGVGLSGILLNHLMWDDDEEYEELSDYIKQNYYIVAKTGDGQFIRIPKGRAVAVIQEAFTQMENLVTGDDEVDLQSFAQLVVENLAPNNPLDNNILAPVLQAATNTTWYGDDLVPTRLQDVPSGEQFDETTDAFSRWLGEKTGLSPYKTNYLLNQYSGAIGDVFLPMMTPKAESGADSPLDYAIAPWKDAFTADSVLKNQNVSDFYDLKDELAIAANGSNATDEDILKSKYMNSVNAELSELYKQKREIQNSNMSDSVKYSKVRDIQQQIVDLMKESMNSYEDISYEDDYRAGGQYARVGERLYKVNDDGEWQKLTDEEVTKYEVTKAAGDSDYATDGTNHYRWYEKENSWRKISNDELERQKEVTSGLGISPEDYWSDKDEYAYAYDYPENYAIAKAVGGYESYTGYSDDLYDIKADKDENGKSISGSRKEKVYDYIYSLDIPEVQKHILFKKEYPSEDTYNYEIIDYLNEREDISYDDMVNILKKLGFDVDSQGNISW